MRRAPRSLAALLLALGIPAGLGAQVASCAGGRPATGDIGLRALRCVGSGAVCSIHVGSEGGGLEHRFSVEPVVIALEDWALTVGIQVGDALVAIDGRLITTGEGGRHLANLVVGDSVAVLVRRDQELSEYRVVTREGCGIRSISVRPGGG